MTDYESVSSKNGSNAKAGEVESEELAEAAEGAPSSSIFEPAESAAPQEAPTSTASEDKVAVLKNKIKRRLINSPGSRMSILSAKEKELSDNESCRSRLGKALSASPDANVLVNQLRNATSGPGLGSHLAQRRRNEGISLYAALNPVDPVDSMIARQLVALNHAVMECHGRAMNTHNIKAREIELRNATKGSNAFGELLKLREKLCEGRTVTIDLNAETSRRKPEKGEGSKRSAAVNTRSKIRKPAAR